MRPHAPTCIGNRFAALALAVLVAGTIVGCAEDLTDLRTEGIDQYRNRQHIESMATMREILELQPSDPEANYYMGLNYRAMASRKFRENDLQAAYRELDTSITYFTQAVKSWPNYMAAISSCCER